MKFLNMVARLLRPCSDCRNAVSPTALTVPTAPMAGTFTMSTATTIVLFHRPIVTHQMILHIRLTLFDRPQTQNMCGTSMHSMDLRPKMLIVQIMRRVMIHPWSAYKFIGMLRHRSAQHFTRSQYSLLHLHIFNVITCQTSSFKLY